MMSSVISIGAGIFIGNILTILFGLLVSLVVGIIR